MDLRPYQQEAVNATWLALRERVAAPLICLPTGAGKTPVVAEMLRQLNEWQKRCLVIAPSVELVEQIHRTARAHCPRVRLGIYAASAGRKDTHTPHLVAQIHSVHGKTPQLGAFDCLIIDEAHMVPPGGDGMYRSLIQDQQSLNPGLRVIGLTATPYRLGSGLVYGDESPFDCMVYDANVGDLIEQGYLSRLRSKKCDDVDRSKLHIRGGEFIASEIDHMMSDADKVHKACAEIVRHGADRQGWLVFCCSVEHALMVSVELQKHGITAPTITGETAKPERERCIADYKAKRLRCLVNVNVLTTGFDAPHIDLIAMLRPTQSPGLYYQMLGRGLRKADGKNDCLILDMAGNIDEHGPINLLNDQQTQRDKRRKAGGEAPEKCCLECGEYVPTSVRECPECGFMFPERPVARHHTEASDLPPVAEADIRRHMVDRVTVSLHRKTGKPDSVRIDYQHGVFDTVCSEWVCVEHDGFAGIKARGWFIARGLEWKSSAKEAVEYLRSVSDTITPVGLVVDHGGKYPRIVRPVWKTEQQREGKETEE